VAIKGAEGLTNRDLAALIDQGARVVVFRYCISIVVITFRRSATVLVRPGQSVKAAGLPYTLMSLALGWWGFPFGLIFTPIAIAQNLSGGTDVTGQMRAAAGGGALPGGPPRGAQVQVLWSDGRSYPAGVRPLPRRARTVGARAACSRGVALRWQNTHLSQNHAARE
jgi:hypothetical protein